jgi:aromatic-L-amino-acid/L-tryptophan decarboxylase
LAENGSLQILLSQIGAGLDQYLEFEHPNLEVLSEPTLSICCFRYIAPGIADIDQFNQRLHRRLVGENEYMPSTTRVKGKLALRPCYVGARANQYKIAILFLI